MAIRKSADRYMAILEGGVRKSKNWVGLPVHNRKTQVGTDELHLLLRFEFFVSMTSFFASQLDNTVLEVGNLNLDSVLR